MLAPTLRPHDAGSAGWTADFCAEAVGQSPAARRLSGPGVAVPGIGFRPSWSDDERALLSNVSTVEQEFAWQAVTGQIDIDAEWDDYVRSMTKAGLDKLLDATAMQGM